jgi:small redox-active disulfide protein 2
MKVEIFGTGCAKCLKTTERLAETIENLGVDAEIVKVTDLEDIIARGVMMTPAVAIDGVMKIEGRIPTEAAIRTWFGK